MAKAFNLTAQINLQGPQNLRPVVSSIRKQLSGISVDIKFNIDNKASKAVDATKKKIDTLNQALINARASAQSLNSVLGSLSSNLSQIQSIGSKTATTVGKTATNMQATTKSIKAATTQMEEFGKQSFLAIKRFAAFSVATTGIFALINAIDAGFRAFIKFDKELIRLQQVTGQGVIGLKGLTDEITRLSVSMGLSSEDITNVAVTLAQAGLSAEETRQALEALAKSSLAPSFDNITDTTEGAIAAIRQFGLEASELEAALGSINAVAAAFAVEAGDIIAAIQRTGGVFASASRGVSEGTDALNEFIAIFTSVRQTTRESAETIATGLRTIFTRIQRAKTIDLLKQFGVELQDVEGKFVGPFEAIKRLSAALNQLDPRDVRFSSIVEELGGFRQIGKVIPLIQQFAVAQQALTVAQKGQNSLSDAQAIAQKSLAVQIAKVREQFLALIRDVGKSSVFQGLTKIVLGLASGLISLAGAFKPILPLLGLIGAIKGASAIGQFASGFFGGVKKGGGAGGVGQNLGESLSGAKEKEKADTTSKAAEAIRENTSAIKALTGSIGTLTTSINNTNDILKNTNFGGGTTLRGGGKVLGFNAGGIVPGSGKGDKIPALLEPGEVVINNKAANKYGRGNLNKMNKYALGGKIDPAISGSDLAKFYPSLQDSIDPNNKYSATIVAKDISSSGDKDKILSQMIKNKRKDKKLLGWQNFELALAQSFGLSLASSRSSYLDYPAQRSEAKFLPADGSYGEDEEDTLIKGNNNETMLAKLIGEGLYKKNTGNKVTTYYTSNPRQIKGIVNSYALGENSTRTKYGAYKLNRGGLIKKFMAGGAAESYYGQAEVEAAKSAQEAYRKAVEEAFSFENLYFEVLEGKSIAEGIEPEVYGTGIGTLKKGEPGVVGTRKVRLSKAVNDQDQVSVAALDAMVENLRKSAFNAREAQMKAYTEAEDSISAFKKSGLLENIDPGIMTYIQETISNLQSGAIDPDVWDTSSVEDITKKLTPSNLKAFSALVSGQRVEVQGQRTKLGEVFNSILETYGSNVSPREQSNITSAVADKLIKGKLKEVSSGGVIQNFMAGGIAEAILGRVPTLDELSGGPFAANKVFAPGEKSWSEILQQVFRESNIPFDATSKNLQLSTDGGIVRLPLKDAISPQKLAAKNFKEKIGESNVKKLEQLREAIVERYVEGRSGVIKAAMPRTQSEAVIAKSQGLFFNAAGMLGKEYSNMPLRIQKGIVSPIDTVVSGYRIDPEIAQQIDQNLSSSLDKSTRREAKKLMISQIIKDITGGNNLVLDFDRTLAIGADKILRDPNNPQFSEFSDRSKVQKALGSSRLTRLGQSLANLVSKSQPETRQQLLDRMSILSARPQSTLDLVQDWLSSKGLPIPLSQFTGIGGPGVTEQQIAQLKASLIPPGSSFVDDNALNVKTAEETGVKSYLYKFGRKKESPDIAGAKGVQFQDMLEYLGAPRRNPNKQSIDFPFGLGPAAKYFNNMPPDLPTDAKRTISSASDLTDNVKNYLIGTGVAQRVPKPVKKFLGGLISKFAFGGKSDGPSFEEVKQKIIDKYPEIQFRISKRKGGFGYNLMGALKSTGGIFGEGSLNFQQPTNLKQLVESSDQLANKLMNPEQLAVGGKPIDSPFDEFKYGSMEGGLAGLITGLYGEPGSIARSFQGAGITQGIDPKAIGSAGPTGLQQSAPQPKKEKIYGKIGLRNTGSEITATYFQNKDRSGFVSAKKSSGDLYTIGLSKATKGYGPRLYDVVMEAATAAGGMLTSDRNQVSDSARAVWAFYFKNRSDVKKTPLDPSQWTKNSKYVDPKLYGKKETWPPPTDEAWILQSGYSKGPDLINSSDVIDMNDPKYAAFIRQQQTSFLSQNTGGKISKFSGGGTVPAMVSNGEAFVPPKVAKKIGYAKLDKMNQADRNGMKGFAAGGVSVFKGPGSGTSDSIGPIGLPQGSYVIREKATKALGLNNGGSVGPIRFKNGGETASQGRKVVAVPVEFLEGVVKTLQVKEEVGGSGKVLSAGLSRLEDILGASLAEGKLSAKGTYEVAKVIRALIDVNADGDKESVAFLSKVYDRLNVLQQRGGGTGLQLPKAQAAVAGVKGVNVSDLEQLKKIFQTKAAVSPGAPGTEALGAIDKITEDLKNGLISNKEATAQLATAIRVSAISAKRAGNEQEAQDLKKLFEAIDKRQQEKGGTQSLKDVTDIRLGLKSTDKSRSVGDLSGLPAAPSMVTGPVEIDLGDIKQQLGPTEQRRDDLKEAAAMSAFTSGNELLDVLKAMKDIVSEQEATKPSVISKYKDEFKAAKTPEEKEKVKAKVKADFAEQEALSSRNRQLIEDLDTLIATEQNAIQSAKLRAESEAYLAEMAKRSGMSLSEFKDKIITEAAATAEKLQNIQGSKDDLKFAAIGSRQVFKSGTTEQKQAATADLKAKLSAADPSLSIEQLDEAVKQLTEDMQSMTWDEAVAANDALTQAMERTVTSQQALEQAYLEAVEKYGDAVGTLEDFQADIAKKQKVDQAGKDFGRLGKLLPDLTSKFASSKFGGGLLKFAKGANDSKGFGNLVGGGLSKIIGKDLGAAVGSKLGGVVSKLGGPIAALGAAASVLGDNLPALYKQFDQLFGTTVAKSETAAGVAGAISGAGTGAATGATLGSFAGPIGTLIGGIGGAIIGGIQGFFRAKIAKQLENSLEALNKSTVALDKAFEEFDLNPTLAGFEKAERAFGEVTVNAGKLDSIAQANTSYFNPLSYVSGPSEEVKQEAIRARSAASTKASESAQRLGAERLKSVSTEDIGRQLSAVRAAGTDPEALKAAYGELAKGSVIVEEYQRAQLQANGINIKAGESLDQYTSAQAQRIKAQAEEQAALDAYRDSQTKAGRSAADVEAEITANRGKAVASGRQVIGEQTALLMKQAELARATKELQLASTNLLEVFKRVVAGIERLSNEQDKYISDLSNFVDDLSGSGRLGPVDRSTEQVLANSAAYSVDEIRAAAGNVAGLTGGTEEANQFANTAIANKIIQDQLPTILAQTEGQDVDAVMDRLEQSIGMALPGVDMTGPGASGVNQIMEQIRRTLEQNAQSRQGTSFDEIAQGDALGVASRTAEEGAKAVLAVQKAYNDSLQKSIDLQNQAMQKYMEAAEYARKASSIRMNADLELKRALGRNISADEAAAPVEQEIRSLTGGLIEGGSLDSRQIGQAIQSQSEANSRLEKSIREREANAGAVALGDPQAAEAFNAALDADRIALMNNKKAVAEATMGLKKLAEDGTRAAAALQAIQNRQNAATKAVDFFRKGLTASPEEVMQMNKDLEAALLVQTGQATDAQLNDFRFRQQAVSGMDMFGQLIPEEGRRAMEADMYEQMLRAQAGGRDLNEIVVASYKNEKGEDVQMTAQQALDAYRKGPEDTPEVKAYKAAVDVQANAALELGRLATVAADKLIEGSRSLFEDLKSELPRILEDSFRDVGNNEDAGAKPPEADKPPVVPPPTGAASTAGTTPAPSSPLVSPGTARGLAATAVGVGGTVAGVSSGTGRRLLGAAYGGISNRTAATVAKGKDLTGRAIAGARGLLPSGVTGTAANPFASMGGSMGAQAAKTAASKGTATVADNVVKTASKVVGKATQAVTQATTAASKTTAVVAKTASTVVGGAAKAAGRAVPFLAPVLGGVAGYMDDSAEAQKRGGVERTILGALTGDASTGSSFSGMLGIEKGTAADQALGIGGAALTGAATGAAIGSVVPVVGTAIGAAVGAVLGGGAEIYKVLTAGDSPLVSWASNLGSSMLGALASANGMFIDATLAAGDFIGSSIYDSISGMWTILTSSVEGIGQFLYDSAASVGSVIKDFFVGTFGTLGEYIYEGATLPLDIIGSVAQNAYNFIKDYFGGVFSTIADAISSIWDWIKGKRKDAKDASEARKQAEEEKKATQTKATEKKEREQATRTEQKKPQQTAAQRPTMAAQQQTMARPDINAYTQGQQPNAMEQMQQAQKEFNEARKKVTLYNQGIEGQPEDIKAYESALEKLNAAKAAVASRASTPAVQPSIQSQPQKPSILDDPRYQLPPETQARLEQIQKKKQQIQTQQNTQATITKPLSKEENFRMRQQETGDLGPDLQQSELVRAAKLDEIRKKENALRVNKIAAAGAGTLKTSPNVAKAQEALDMAKQDLAIIDERLGSLNQKYVSPQPLQQIADMQKLPSSTGGYRMSPEEQDFMAKTTAMVPSSSSDIENMASQLSSGFANNQYMTEAGVLMAQSFTKSIGGGVQVNTGLASAITSTETGQVTPTQAGIGGTTIILDENSRQFLSNFNTTINKIGSYIEQLSGINIPDKIELTLNIPAPLEVRITGAAGLEKLEQSTRDMAETLVSNKINELRTELNSFSQGAIKGPASRGTP